MFSEVLKYMPPATSVRSQPIVHHGERIVALGDSITEAGGYLRMIDAVFARHYPNLRVPPIVNAGVGGNKSGDMLARLEPDVLARRPDRVLINVGINDVWHNLDLPDDAGVLDSYRADVARMVELAQDRNCRLMLLAPTIIEERADSTGNRRLERYVSAMREVADKAFCPFCDLHALFLAVLAARPGGHSANWLTSDGVHMSPAGDAVMAVGVLRALGVPDSLIAATRFRT